MSSSSTTSTTIISLACFASWGRCAESTTDSSVFFAVDPVDLRKGFDGLANIARSLLGEDPLSGHLFIFINRRGNRAKILFGDRSGWCIYYKRHERGTFRPPQRRGFADNKVELEAAELMLILEGIDLTDARRRRRRKSESTSQQRLASPHQM